MASLSDQLRRRLGDRRTSANNKPFFDDKEIEEFLIENNNDLNLAALRGWEAKLAEYVKFVDIDESGSVRRLSQLAKNAVLMIKHYADLTDRDAEVIAGRVIGRAVNLRENTSEAVMATSGTHRMLPGYPAEGVQAT